jgi:hypothetical protein
LKPYATCVQATYDLLAQILDYLRTDTHSLRDAVAAAFEQKESGDACVLEKLAREMLAHDPALKAEFETRLQSDQAFAASPQARLDFFYRRSPWYAMQHVGRYPVLKLDAAGLAAARQEN